MQGQGVSTNRFGDLERKDFIFWRAIMADNVEENFEDDSGVFVIEEDEGGNESNKPKDLNAPPSPRQQEQLLEETEDPEEEEVDEDSIPVVRLSVYTFRVELIMLPTQILQETPEMREEGLKKIKAELIGMRYIRT